MKLMIVIEKSIDKNVPKIIKNTLAPSIPVRLDKLPN